jgi:UDP-2,3-diacylglucosamine pyrophosphatase LpxH
MATRVAIISDLHLGGDRPGMMSRPERLARFLATLPQRVQPDETLHLVVDGDFVDFLAAKPWRPFTADPHEAVQKLEATARDERFTPIFSALARLLRAGTPIDLLIGNHDLELALPPVYRALLKLLETSPERLRLHSDGSALQMGALLVEHGNRYDGANANDWTDLRAIASALSRFETPSHELDPSPGSRLVEAVVNPIKARYPFVDLLKPTGELTALLLFAFEPSFARHAERIAFILRGARLRGGDKRSTRHAISQIEDPDDALAATFDGLYANLRAPPHHHVPLHDWLDFAVERDRHGIAGRLERGEPLDHGQLQRIRLALHRLLLDDRSAAPDGPTGHQGAEAARILAAGAGAISTVVMGHTHLARHVGSGERASYINTGTWADVVRVPAAAMDDDGALEAFLRDLHADVRPDAPATWADVRLGNDGAVERAVLQHEK